MPANSDRASADSDGDNGEAKREREASGGAGEIPYAPAGMGVTPPLASTVITEVNQTDIGLAHTLLFTGSRSTEPAATAATSEAARVPSLNQHYTLAENESTEQELGRGGIGRVVVATEQQLRRAVAIKRLLPDLTTQLPAAEVAAYEARLIREARVTGQLEHPNIVPVYELGRDDSGHPYYAMRIIRGRTLDAALESAGALPQRLALLNHFIDLCQAIAYAHSRGVVHRDIKPENVMIGEFGETIVLDWGVAKVKGEQSSTAAEVTIDPNLAGLSLAAEPENTSLAPRSRPLPAPTLSESVQRPVSDVLAGALEPVGLQVTVMGNLVGTPIYMSPEQALGNVDEVDERSDVWALGVVLYRLLAGRLPFDATTLSELKRKIVEAKPPALAEADPQIPGELIAISERALRKSKNKRYQTAKELVDEVEAFLNGTRVRAYEYSSLYLLKRFLTRHRAVVGVTVLSLLTLLSLAWVSYLRVVEARDRAVIAEQQALENEHKASQSLAEAFAKRAEIAGTMRDTVGAELFAARALTLEERPDARGMLLTMMGLKRPVPMSDVNWSSQCTSSAYSYATKQVACAFEDTLELLDESGALQARVKIPLPVSGLAFADSKGALFVATEGGTIVRLELERRELSGVTLRESAAVSHLTYNEAAGKLAFVVGEHRVRVVTADLADTHDDVSFDEPIASLDLAPDGSKLAVGSRLGKVWLRSASKAPSILGRHAGTVSALAFDSKGTLLASGGADRTLRIWDLREAVPTGNPLAASGAATHIAWSPSSRHLVFGTREHEIHWVDVQLERTQTVFNAHQGEIDALRFADDSTAFVSLGNAPNLRHWQLPSDVMGERLLDRGNVLALEFGGGESQLLSAGLGPSGVCLFDLRSGECSTRLPVRAQRVRTLAVSVDAALLAVGGSDGSIVLWSLRDRIPLGALSGHVGELRGLAVSKDGKFVLSAGLDKSVRLWDTASTKMLSKLELTQAVYALSLSSDGKRVALATQAGTIEVYDSRLTERQLVVAGHSDWVTAVRFTSGDSRIVSGSADRSVRCFDARSGAEQWQASDAEARILSLDTSPDGRWLAAAGEGSTIRIRSVESGKLLAQLRDHAGTVRALRFAPGGNWLASGGDDRKVRLWSLAGLELDASAHIDAVSARFHVRLKGAEVEHY